MLLNKELTEKVLAVKTAEELKQVIDGQDLMTVSRLAINQALKKVFNLTCYGIKETAVDMLVKASNGEKAEDIPVVPDIKSIKADRRKQQVNPTKALSEIEIRERNEAIDKILPTVLDTCGEKRLTLRQLRSSKYGLKDLDLKEDDLKAFSERNPEKYVCAINDHGMYYILIGVDKQWMEEVHKGWGDKFFGHYE